MIRSLLLLVAALSLGASQKFVASKVCAKCHPVIYKEYMGSMHRNSSVANDPVHRAVWDKHPLKKKEKYNCGVCHTPSDTALTEALAKGEPALPEDNEIQKNEPIGCAYCHRIQSIRTHARQNLNIVNETPKYYYAAKDGKSQEEKVEFHKTSSFFGLNRKTSGSPFHTIDYSNKLFSTGHICLGCHDHKQNKHGFAICSMNIKENDPEKHTCIACHMPQIPGSYSTIVKSETHAYHGFAGPHVRPELLRHAVSLEAKNVDGKLRVKIVNHSIHKLFTHPLRLGQLRIEIRRGGKTIEAKPVNFFTLLGHEGKPAMPWVADEVLKTNAIDASSEKVIDTDIPLEKGDHVTLTLGFHIVNPKAAAKLGIDDKEITDFKVLKSETFLF